MFLDGLFEREHLSTDDLVNIVKLREKAKENGNDIDTEEIKRLMEKNKKIENIVTASDLKYSFYKTLDSIKSKLNSKENKNKIYEKSSINGKIIWLALMIIIIFVLNVIKIDPAIVKSLTSFIYLIAEGVLIIALFIKMKFSIRKVFVIAYFASVLVIPTAIIILPKLIISTTDIIMFVVSLICILLIIMYMVLMPKRTKYGNEMLGKLRGFKRFLEIAEKEQIESLVEQNPEYFYDILPYTYALGVSKKWISQFETIAVQPPEWYYSYNTFDINIFGTFMNNTMSSVSRAMVSTPSSDGGSYGSSGGFSSGGGFSGGGSGGGGGGSW